LRQRKGTRHRNELDFQIGITRRQSAKPWREEGYAEAVRRADAHRSRNRRIDATEIGLGIQHFSFHALRTRKEPLTLLRQFAAIGAAQEELGADGGFQRGNPAAESGMVHTELSGRGKKLAASRHAQEQTYIIPVHATFLVSIFAQLMLISGD
jgi:hypothetical protein